MGARDHAPSELGAGDRHRSVIDRCCRAVKRRCQSDCHRRVMVLYASSERVGPVVHERIEPFRDRKSHGSKIQVQDGGHCAVQGQIAVL